MNTSSPTVPVTTPVCDECEIVIVRLIDAPRALVFRAFTDAQQLAQWWGPHSFANPVCDVDARPGGILRIHMQSPDGTSYPCQGIYHEVVENERLVYSMEPEVGTDASAIWERIAPPRKAIHSVIFEDQDGKTKLTTTLRLTSKDDRDAMVEMGFNGGYTQSLERLEALLEKG